MKIDVKAGTSTEKRNKKLSSPHIQTIDIESWDKSIPSDIQSEAIEALESGKVVYFPNLPFLLNKNEYKFLSPDKIKAKNISYDIHTDRLAGALYEGSEAEELKEMIRTFARNTSSLLNKLLPQYSAHLIQAKTSFRPVQTSGRKSSYRKDDTRLHLDSFPSNPTKGKRILRVFSNINQAGEPRVWRLGEPLENVLRRFLPKVSAPIWGSATLLKLLGITKDYRTPYDHYMLAVHNAMKADENYQRTVQQEEVRLPPGSTWMVYTDQASHAAMSGQHLLEQTFHLPPSALQAEETAPVRVMEKLLGKNLI